MEFIFLSLYDFFKNRRPLFYVIFIGSLAFFAIEASQIRLEEDITKFFPNDKKVENLNRIFQDSKFLEKLVVMVSWEDAAHEPHPDSLIAATEDMVEKLHAEGEQYIKTIKYTVDADVALSMFETITEHLPVFLNDNDYSAIDSLIQPRTLRQTLENDYRQLVSPAGLVLKKMIVKDPVGISMLVMQKLQGLQYDENYVLYDSYIMTRDHRNLVFFILPTYPPNDTGHNVKLVETLDAVTGRIEGLHDKVSVTYFGAAAVAAGNATQLRNDTILTLVIMTVVLLVFLVWYFRKKRAPLIILIPVIFGGIFSLAVVNLLQGSISVLAIAAGSMILGIAINYSLHFFVHLRHSHDVRLVIKELAQPMTIGSTTTVLAFLFLQFVNAAVLRDVGLFAAFSLVGAALCSLIFLPHLVRSDLFAKGNRQRHTWVDKISSLRPEYNRYLVRTIFLLTPVFLYFAGDVSFNTDMNTLNFMDKDLREAEKQLNTINEFSLRSVYLVTEGRNLEEALRRQEVLSEHINDLKEEGLVKKVSSVSSFIVSDSIQQLRLSKWNAYWTADKKAQLMSALREEGAKQKFSSSAFDSFENLLNANYNPVTEEARKSMREQFFDDYITEKNGIATVVTLAKVDPDRKSELYTRLDKEQHVHALDKQLLANLFVEFVHADFNFIVTFTSILVFVALLISFGRIELTLITFIPMLITWVWILGIMGLLGIQFNIVNVMISTFIFGLGDDYSIFIMDGLQQEFRYKRPALTAIKSSIFLSAFTTIAGLGVLIFAQHPALKSIAAISIIGILSVFVMSQTIEPYLFSVFIQRRANKGLAPITLWGLCKTVFAFFYFIGGSFILTIIGFILIKLFPFARRHMRLFYHTLVSAFSRSLVYVMANVKKRVIGASEKFERASVIICNHQSFLDILVTTMLHPKIILLTNKWVWNSPVFGGVVRLADYYPVTEGADQSVEQLHERSREGYSIVVFPEGTRSADGKMKRFHKGAFFIAEKLNLPIQPLILHGTGDTIRKGDFYLNDSTMTLKFLPRIDPNDESFGTTYSERAKSIGRYFRTQYEILDQEARTPAANRYKVIANFLYKGPVLEWYMRVKMSLEKNYEPFHKLIPHDASILDLGCGYGFLCYMLFYLSDNRTVKGVDYDEDKIVTAQNGFGRTERLTFEAADVTTYAMEANYDVIIIADVLHYLTPELQTRVLENSFRAIKPGGKVIIREGNKDIKDRHKGTQLTELFSVKLLKFNKSANELHFMSGDTIKGIANRLGLTAETIDETKFTSNVIFVIHKPTASTVT